MARELMTDEMEGGPINLLSRRPNQDTATKFHSARSQAFTTWAEVTASPWPRTRIRQCSPGLVSSHSAVRSFLLGLTSTSIAIDQRHILKLLDRELIYAGGGLELLQRGHSSGSGGQLGRRKPEHGGSGGE
jgi:hypothetical protein